MQDPKDFIEAFDVDPISKLKEIKGFFGEYRWLSNFWYSKIYYNGNWYPSVEAAYQVAKCADEAVRSKLILEVFDYAPGKIKKLGKSVKIREDWEQVKLDIMLELTRLKYTKAFDEYNHPMDLGQKLLDTGDAYLEETNFWGDIVYGVRKGVGENNLGKILMRVRDEIRKARV